MSGFVHRRVHRVMPPVLLVSVILCGTGDAFPGTRASDSSGTVPDRAGRGAGLDTSKDASERPTTKPAKRKRVDVHLEFLLSEYQKLLASPDWMTRALAVISMSRVPRDDATEPLLVVLDADKDPVVRLVAWQALLSRAPRLSRPQYERWLAETVTLSERNVFGGRLRAPMLDLLSTAAADKARVRAVRRAFDAGEFETSRSSSTPRAPAAGARDPDAPGATAPRNEKGDGVARALARCVLKWRSAELVEHLLKQGKQPATAARAAEVLRLVGFPGDVSGYLDWWKENKNDWVAGRAGEDVIAGGDDGEEMTTPASPDDEPWRTLRPQFIAAADWDRPPDLDAGHWREDLELRKPNLKAFDLAFVVDATGSMSSTIEWLRGDVSSAMRALAYIAREPRIGLTFYRDKGDEFVARTLPLTGKVNLLVTGVAQMQAGGGGDTPEAVLEGLTDCLKRNPWHRADRVPKVVVLIGDAPPHAETQEACERLVADAAKKGVKLYAVKLNSELESFDKLAAAGGGEALTVSPGELGSVVLPPILVDAISPQYKDRVGPLVDILLEAVRADAESLKTGAAAGRSRRF